VVFEAPILHILFVWAYWQYPQVALEFLQKIKKRGHKISVLLGKKHGEIEKGFVDDGIDFHFAPSWDFGPNILGSPYPIFKNVSSCIKMVDPDVVHINSHLFFSNYQVSKATHLMKISSVVTVHGIMAKRDLIVNASQGIYLRTIAKSIFKKASAVICLTRGDAESVANIIGNFEKIFIVPNGVDTEIFKPTSIKDSNLIAWVGRLVPEKGLVYLLLATKEIVEKHSDARLILIGDGPLRNDLMNLVNKLGLTGKVDFIGSVDRMEVAKLLSKSSIFAFPSLKEGLPISVLEAMACGVPVVGSNISGVNDVVKHDENGFLVQPKTPKALANAILDLLNDENLRERLGQNARRLMVEKYGWDRIINRMEEVYREAIENAPFTKRK